MSRITSSIRIRREPAAVFDFFTAPANAPRWHPASVSVAGAVDHQAKLGETFSEDLVGADGVRGRAKWQVVANEAPYLWRIELRSASIPMEAAVALRFRPEQGATAVERDVRYRYRSRWFRLLDALLLRRRNQRDGDQGLRQAKRLLEAGLTTAGGA
ncbi:SRPBCC family protein [Phenylobacterium zucineum]|nr:SRPBCC family protein [Phenylobacterium zucineum]